VTLREADGIGTTRIIDQAWIDTSSFDTSLRVQAFAVRLATRIDTSNLRVTNGAFRTSADGAMSRNEAFSSLSTVTRVTANSVQASLFGAAFVISDTACFIVKNQGDATSVRVRHPTFSARANHGSEGDSVHN
jgi:hypothetical protein